MRGGKRTFNQERATETVHAALDQASSLAQTIIEQAANRAIEGAQKAREASSNVSARATDRLDQASKTLEHDVAPSVKDVAFQAATVALELWQTARDKAEQAIETGMTGVTAVPDAAEHALEAAERRVEDVGAMAKSASRHAANATADAGKETGSTLLWAGAAAGLVLYGVLQKERREQVLRYAQSALDIARDLIGDYRGEDASFDSTAS